MTYPSLTIRVLESHADYFRAEDAQRAIWDMHDDISVVPLHVLITTQKSGGLVAGAFDDVDHMIGFVYSFLGLTASGRLKHCSHMMGVLPEFRRTGIGEALKRFQADYARGQGIELITWTFDPLEGVNASLNIGKLRTVARTYYPNLYAELADNLNKGLPSDRFEVEWWINHPRVIQPPPVRPTVTELLAGGAVLVNPPRRDPGSGLIRSGEVHNPAPDDSIHRLLVEVPSNYQSIKAADIAIAREWRYHTRSIFEHLFRYSYIITDFISEAQGEERHNYYVLEKEPPIPDV